MKESRTRIIYMIVSGGAVCLLLVAVTFLSPIAIRANKIIATKTRMENRILILRNDELPEMEKEVSVATRMESLWGALIEKHELLTRQVPENPEIGILIEEFTDIAEKTGVEILNASSTGTILKPGFSTVPIELSVRCSYSKLEDLIREIESAERLLRIDAFRIDSDMTIDPLLHIEFKISAFIRSSGMAQSPNESG
ncbi:MAG: type 4a pilus biogenesis protein PilO [Candidatus Krumholzibacteriota bacterium]|nr:type 4a pilus biogenesis protein PilO [Candidatus Krumholzibacteriota bacterium]